MPNRWHLFVGRFISAVLLTLFMAPGLFAGETIRCLEPEPSTGTSKAVVVAPSALAHTAQLFPINKKGDIVGEGDVRKQTKQLLANLALALRAGQSDMEQVVKLNLYVRRASLVPEVNEILAKTFTGKIKPALTVVAGDLPHSDALIALDAVAVSRQAHDPKLVLTARSGSLFVTKNPHVAVLTSRGAVYVSGMAEKGEIQEATGKTLEKLEAAIAHLGLGKGHILQLKAFLDPISDAEKVRETIDAYFAPMPTPVLIFVEWVAASVPIEIELIAALPLDHPKQCATNIHYVTPPGTKASPVYSRMAEVCGGKRIYFSGLYGRTDATNDVKEIYAQLRDLVANSGSDFDHLAKATYYYSDPASNSRLDVWRPTVYNPNTPPTASKARVKDVGRVGKGIGIDMIGVGR